MAFNNICVVCVLERCELQTDTDVLKHLGYLINIKWKILIDLCFLPMPFSSCSGKKELLELCISHWWRWCLHQAIYCLFVAESMFEASYNRNQPTLHVARQSAVCLMAEYEKDEMFNEKSKGARALQHWVCLAQSIVTSSIARSYKSMCYA